MPATTTKPPESDEFQEQMRALAQLNQADRLTMSGHIRKKLNLRNRRLEKTYRDAEQLPAGADGEVDDDMQILARDITFNDQQTPVLNQPAVSPPKQSRWPLAAALALGLGVPGTTGVLMAPKIIQAFRGDQPVVTAPPQQERPEYAPILFPGKPQGVQ